MNTILLLIKSLYAKEGPTKTALTVLVTVLTAFIVLVGLKVLGVDVAQHLDRLLSLLGA